MVFDDYLAISRDTYGGFMSQGGFSGERKFFYKDISSIEYRKPTLLANGYIKILVPGAHETNAKVGLFRSSSGSMRDQNTVVLRAFTSNVGIETDKIYNIIMEKLTRAKSSAPLNPILNTTTKMDELKKLGDLKIAGVLTEEEFQKEKEKLLNN